MWEDIRKWSFLLTNIQSNLADSHNELKNVQNNQFEGKKDKQKVRSVKSMVEKKALGSIILTPNFYSNVLIIKVYWAIQRV